MFLGAKCSGPVGVWKQDFHSIGRLLAGQCLYRTCRPQVDKGSVSRDIKILWGKIVGYLPQIVALLRYCLYRTRPLRIDNWTGS